MKEKIGIFGGTFDPIHTGHLRVAEEVRENLDLDRVIFVPAHIQPLKIAGKAAEADHRLEMAKLAVEANPRFEVDNCEILRGGASYTVETLEYYGNKKPDAGIFFIIGSDAWQSITLWRDYERLFELAMVVVMTRPGYRAATPGEVLPSGISGRFEKDGDTYSLGSEGGVRFVSVSRLDISGTSIRELLKAGKSVKYIVPTAVEEYLRKNKLYS